MGREKKLSRAERHADATFTPIGYSQAQRTMRTDMEEPKKVGELIDLELGIQRTQDPDVTKLAYKIINDHPEVSMPLSQWARVQAMIEEGIVAGLQIGRLGQE